MIARAVPGAEAASTQAVDGSQGAAFDLLKNLERPKE